MKNFKDFLKDVYKFYNTQWIGKDIFVVEYDNCLVKEVILLSKDLKSERGKFWLDKNGVEITKEEAHKEIIKTNFKNKEV